MTYVFDMTEMAEMLEAFSAEMEEGEEKKEMEESMNMDEIGLDSIADVLKSLPGISKVKLSSGDKWKQSIEYSFADLKALNSALNVLWSQEGGRSEEHVFFRKEGNKIIRDHDNSATEMGADMGEEGGDAEEILAAMKYKMSFSFKQEIKSVSGGTGAEMSTNGKKLDFSTDFKQISTHDDALDLTFEFE